MPLQVHDQELDAHFFTFSCYHRRRLLDDDRAKLIVVDTLRTQLGKRQAECYGFVVMPDHVHAVVRFSCVGQVSAFMQHWKQTSSFHIKRLLQTTLRKYSDIFDSADPVWQRHYYDFNIFSLGKLMEKLTYMHANPVRPGLAESPEQWQFGSARFYEKGETVGVPLVCPL